LLTNAEAIPSLATEEGAVLACAVDSLAIKEPEEIPTES